MKIYKLSLSISLFLSLLIITILSTYTFLALSNFYLYQKKVNPKIELTLDRFHFFLKNEIKKEFVHITAQNLKSDLESPLVTFHITANIEDINSLNENLPSSGKDHFIDANMLVSNSKKTYKVKLRYRGDTNLHWFYKQKSLRIKLQGNDVYNMDKQFNLNNSPSWSFHRDMITYKLAEKLGILSPSYFPVRVILNGKYMGVYMYLSQVDESLLRKHKVMPGSIYFGDSAPINKNGVKNVWDNESYWKKKASRNAEQKNNREDIEFFVKLPYEKNQKKFYLEFYKQFDVDKFASFMALDRLFGTGHHDFYHNHKVYFDPYKGKFEPIEWDMRNWFITKNKDVSMYPLLLKIKQNPMLDSIIDKKVYSLIENNISEDISNAIDTIYNQTKDDLKSDYYKDNGIINRKIANSWIAVPFFDDDYNKWIHSDKSFIITKINMLMKIYNNLELKYNLSRVRGNEFKLNIMLKGESPIQIKFNNYKNITQLKGKNLYNDINGTTIYPGRKLISNSRKKNKKIYGKDKVDNVPQYYEFLITTEDIKSFENSLEFINFITNQKVHASKENFIINYDKDIIHPFDYIPKHKEIVNLSGDIDVNQTLVFDQYTTVNIAPGTIFKLHENMSIFFYGKVLARGSKEKPIKFLAYDSLKPWGIVVVQGKKTSGSKFIYCEFKDGSIDSRRMIHYTSPFNIHDMDWFDVRYCKIQQNFIGDDSMHVAYAKGIIDNCEFINARSDGLDIDISDVNITNNIFYRSGNDGLDIMTTKMAASNNIFVDMGDKGISVGEWSQAEIIDSLFIRSSIGLEIKDKSVVDANNLIFIDSKDKAINLYNKNKRYNKGGYLYADNIYLLNNIKTIADDYSILSIKNKFENKIPDLSNYKFYKILNTSKLFKKEVDFVY